MNNKENPKDIKQSFIEKIKRKEKRKLRAQRKKGQAIWFGLGLFGVIGWSVMVPTLIGIAVGIWADRRWPGNISFDFSLCRDYSWLSKCLVLGRERKKRN